MIVDTMNALEIRKAYLKDLEQLRPIIQRRIQYLTRSFLKSGKQFFQKPSLYTINQNHYIINYILNKSVGAFSVHWHYITNSKQPYFLASMSTHNQEHYYIKVDAHAILRYIKRTPDYLPTDKEAFAKEAINITSELAFPVPVEANYISPEGLWPLEHQEIVNGFLHVKTFIHKSMLNNRQREIYKRGLLGISPDAIPLYLQSLEEFGVVR
ncbi:MAG: hypothetical protein KF763_15240 [Cyclobacteriaceae bacterium]|nr:hypothetical protein [Cyclobacteriaceae bacterium]